MDESGQPASPARHTILLVDDDARVRYYLILLLRWAGDWEVVGEASDGATALGLAGALHPELILLDRWLADGDALRLIPHLRALLPPPQVAILTGDQSAAGQSREPARGATAYLDKMTPPLTLLEALRALVHAGGSPRPGATMDDG
jgi:DNA-binding NarL/FixJ family response regulator